MRLSPAKPLVHNPSAYGVQTATERQKDTNHQVLIRLQKN